MTEVKVYSDYEGDFSEDKSCPNVECPKCKKKSIVYSIWDSHCGGYEDTKYKCTNCKHYWWVDGPDS